MTLRNEDNLLWIDSLAKCKTSGSDMLKIVYDFAKTIPNINLIGLSDGSSISQCKININLAFLKILSKGQSWYNSLGYVSKDYDTEKIHNEELINMRYIDFIQLCINNNAEIYRNEIQNTNLNNDIQDIEKEIQKECNVDADASCNGLIEYLNILKQQNEDIKNKGIDKMVAEFKEEKTKLYGNTSVWKNTDENILTRDFFIMVSNELQETDCNKEIQKIQWLADLIEFIKESNVIQYKGGLNKQTQQRGGKSKFKRKLKKNKPKRKKIN